MPGTRTLLLSILLFAGMDAFACTLFKVTKGGATMVGNNEDAWSINAQIRFENGKPGEFGAVYLGHFNGSPMRAMLDQGGMNEAGLMFDGLSVPYKPMPRKENLPWGDFESILHHVMRTCSTVQEAAVVFRAYDMSLIAHAMIVLVDRSGEYLVVEGDTLFTGNDPTYAVGNFRPSTCVDLDAVNIPRYQKGRALLATGADTSLAFCTAVMDSMRACRIKLGNGTLYTDILDLEHGLVHLYFYHDFTECHTFNLKEELAKGDHTYVMASLFGARPEYDRLVAYITPFHQRWLFWGLLALAMVMCCTALYATVSLVRGVIAHGRRGTSASFAPLTSMGLVSVLIICLIGVLLTNEGVYYFGLGEVAPALAWLPIALVVLALPIARAAFMRTRPDIRTRTMIVLLRTVTLSVLLVVVLAFYWGTLLP